ncbi:hypothetical protein ACJZ2D_002613 [Fusarium nematophilum]
MRRRKSNRATARGIPPNAQVKPLETAALQNATAGALSQAAANRADKCMWKAAASGTKADATKAPTTWQED